MSTARLRDRIASILPSLVLGALLAFVVHYAYWNTGAFGDEGSSCTLGQEMLHGHLPYRDYFNEKMPLQYVWTAAVMSVTTTGVAGARIAAALSLTGVFALLVHRLRSGASAWSKWPWLLLAVLVCAGMWGYNNTAESSLALLFGAAAVLISRREGALNQREAVALGVLHGLAIGFRMTSVAAAVVVLGSPWIAGHRVAFAIGVSGAVVGWVALLAAIGVQPSDLASALFFHVGSDDVVHYFRGIEPEERIWALVWVAAGASALVACGNRRRAAWTAVWLLALAIPFFARMDAFRLWPSTVAAAVFFLPWLMQARWAVRAAVAFGVAVPLIYFLEEPGTFDHYSEIATYVRNRTGPKDTIWVAPWSPYVYCLSERETATRFYFLLPWIAQDAVKAEVLRDLERNKPALIVDVSRGRRSLPAMLPGLQELLDARYEAPVRMPRATYYHLKQDDG